MSSAAWKMLFAFFIRPTPIQPSKLVSRHPPDPLAAPCSGPCLRGPTAPVPSPTEHFPPALWSEFLYHCPSRSPTVTWPSPREALYQSEYVTLLNTCLASSWPGMVWRVVGFILLLLSVGGKKDQERERGRITFRQLIPRGQALNHCPSLLATAKTSGWENGSGD